MHNIQFTVNGRSNTKDQNTGAHVEVNALM